MPLISVNLAKEMGYGMTAKSNNEDYTIIAHIGGTAAIACKVNDPMPAPLYLIQIDLKTEDPKPEGGNGGQQPPDKTPAPG